MRRLLIRYHMWAIRRHAARLTTAQLVRMGFRDETEDERIEAFDREFVPDCDTEGL